MEADRLHRYSIALLMLVLSQLPALAVASPEGSPASDIVGRTLAELEGETFRVFPVKRHSGTPVGKYEPISRPIDLVVLSILVLVSNSPDGVKLNLSLTGNVTVGGETFYFYEGVYRGRRVLFVMGDLGDLLVLVNDGTAAPWMTCAPIMANISWALSYFLHDYSEPLFVGQSGESVVEELPAYQCDEYTGECSQVEGEPQVAYENPYELYTFNIDGLPLKPYLRARCTDPGMNAGFKMVYLEGFIPTLYTINYTRVTVNETMISGILEFFRESGVSVGASDIIVEDAYYTLGEGRRLLPTLILYAGGLHVKVQLAPEGPRLLAVFQGQQGARAEERIDWNEILARASPPGEESIARSHMLAIVAALLAGTAAVVLVRRTIAKPRVRRESMPPGAGPRL